MQPKPKPSCRCHWPVPAAVEAGEVQYICLYCGVALVSPRILAERKARMEARIKEMLKGEE